MRSGSRLLTALLLIFVGAAVFAEDPQPDADESQSIGCTPAQRRAGCKDSSSEPEREREPEREFVPTNDAGRLGMIWSAYQAYKGFHDGVFDRCQSLGVETAQARAANHKFDEQVEAKLPLLKQRLTEALRANGFTDPEARMREVDGTVVEATKARVDKMFVAKAAEDPKQFCELAVSELGMLESSFRFSDFYERLMAL